MERRQGGAKEEQNKSKNGCILAPGVEDKNLDANIVFTH